MRYFFIVNHILCDAIARSSKSQQKSKKESGSKKRKKSPREDLVKNRRAGAKDSSKHGKGDDSRISSEH